MNNSKLNIYFFLNITPFSPLGIFPTKIRNINQNFQNIDAVGYILQRDLEPVFYQPSALLPDISYYLVEGGYSQFKPRHHSH